MYTALVCTGEKLREREERKGELDIGGDESEDDSESGEKTGKLRDWLRVSTAYYTHLQHISFCVKWKYIINASSGRRIVREQQSSNDASVNVKDCTVTAARGQKSV